MITSPVSKESEGVGRRRPHRDAQEPAHIPRVADAASFERITQEAQHNQATPWSDPITLDSGGDGVISFDGRKAPTSVTNGYYIRSETHLHTCARLVPASSSVRE